MSDHKEVKKTIITFKNNLNGYTTKTDMFTGRKYVDNATASSVLFTGTDKELSDYADELINEGYFIQDFYDYEEENE